MDLESSKVLLHIIILHLKSHSLWFFVTLPNYDNVRERGVGWWSGIETKNQAKLHDTHGCRSKS